MDRTSKIINKNKQKRIKKIFFQDYELKNTEKKSAKNAGSIAAQEYELKDCKVFMDSIDYHYACDYYFAHYLLWFL